MKDLKHLNKNLFFDLDGTIFNSYEGIIESLLYAFKKANIEVPDIDFKTIIGPPFKKSLPKFTKNEEELIKLTSYYREVYNEKNYKLGHIYKNMEKVLKELQEKGYNLYVATCKPEKIAKKIISYFDLDKYFVDVFGAHEDAIKGRQLKEEVLQHAFDNSEAEANTSIMIGDSSSDFNGAKYHNMKFGAVTFGFGGHEIIADDNYFTVDKAEDMLLYFD